jgi:hypothetical protein
MKSREKQMKWINNNNNENNYFLKVLIFGNKRRNDLHWIQFEEILRILECKTMDLEITLDFLPGEKIIKKTYGFVSHQIFIIIPIHICYKSHRISL